MPYTVTAATHGHTELVNGIPSMYNPAVPSRALANSSPTGLILWTIGPAKNRRVNISRLVQMNAIRAVFWFSSTRSVMFVIQLSVPSSTYPTSACSTYRNRMSRLPNANRVTTAHPAHTTPAPAHPTHCGNAVPAAFPTSGRICVFSVSPNSPTAAATPTMPTVPIWSAIDTPAASASDRGKGRLNMSSP